MTGDRISANSLKSIWVLFPGHHLRVQDVEERFIRSSAKGGQNVNKVATCVYLRHIPTGISVKCSQERSQEANRKNAWALLLTKILNDRAQAISRYRDIQEKIRRMKRRRSKAGQERVLERKRYRSEKKFSRRKMSVQSRTEE